MFVLIALTFEPIPNSKTQLHHKDKNNNLISQKCVTTSEDAVVQVIGSQNLFNLVETC